MIQGRSKKLLGLFAAGLIGILGITSCAQLYGDSGDTGGLGIPYVPNLVFSLIDRSTSPATSSLQMCDLDYCATGSATIVNDADDVFSIKSDELNGNVYFTSLFDLDAPTHTSKIQSYCFANSRGCSGYTIVYPSTGTIAGIETDAADALLYWSSSDGSIKSCSITPGISCLENEGPVTDLGYSTSGLGLNPATEWLYWVDLHGDKIMGCPTLAGPDSCLDNTTTIANTEAPHGMKVSTYSQIIYWISLSRDGIDSEIMSCPISTSLCDSLQILVDTENPIADAAMSPYRDILYWSESEQGTSIGSQPKAIIFSCEISNCSGTTQTILERENAYIGTLVVVNGY